MSLKETEGQSREQRINAILNSKNESEIAVIPY